MRVTVMSRADAVIYCYKSHEKPAIMISISDPYIQYEDSPFCSPNNRILDILPLSFADADAPGPDVYGRNAGVSDLMSNVDGNKIAAFIKQHPNTDIIVHCDAGISRSAGVAAAILKLYTGDDSAIFDNPYYYPNMWCYRAQGPVGADLSKYEGVKLYGVPATAIMEGYNVCQLQPDPGFSDDNNYLLNAVAEEAKLDFSKELPKETLVNAAGEDVTDEVYQAYDWLREHTF